MQAYVIMKKGFEYDDNIYNESDGGEPKKIFFSKKDADEEASKLNIEEIKNCDIHDYAYDIEDIINDPEKTSEYLKSLNEKYGKPTPKNKWEDFGEYQLNPKATDEEAKEYLSMIKIRFFEIKKVDIDVTSYRDFKIEEVLS